MRVELELKYTSITVRAGTGSESSGLVYGLGFPKFVSKPIVLLEVIARYAVVIVMEPIMLSTKPAGFGANRARALWGF